MDTFVAMPPIAGNKGCDGNDDELPAAVVCGEEGGRSGLFVLAVSLLVVAVVILLLLVVVLLMAGDVEGSVR